VCCSCPQAKLLIAQAADKKCWHIMFMQYRKKEIDQMVYCVDENVPSVATEYGFVLGHHLVYVCIYLI
jgi:hypothetical protein